MGEKKKIAHLVLACQYCDGFLYQENQLAYQNQIDGYDVLVIASINIIGTSGEMSALEFTKPGRFIDKNGVKVVRVPYRFPLSNIINSKIRAYKGVIQELEAYKPDLIMFHGVGGAGILDAVAYKERHPEVLLIIDNHASFANSGKSFFSKYIYHSFFSRLLWRRAWKISDRIYNISDSCADFLEQIYGVPKYQTQILPLCGNVLTDAEYQKRRRRTRERLGLSSSQLLFLHTGKMVAYKKPWDIVESFVQLQKSDSVMVLAGNMDKVTTKKTQEMLNDSTSIMHVGWVDETALLDLLCATDVYVQGWSQSATVQHAACQRCALIVPCCDMYEYLFGSSPFYIQEKEDIYRAMRSAILRHDDLMERARDIYEQAQQKCSYATLAKTIYKLIK